ncbi:MAG: YgaP-like transmembrane domain [Pseudomonadota bacterium]
MKYFELTENVSDVESVFRVLLGIGLLGVTLLGPLSIMYSTIFPMLGAYFILTAIMKWDPIGYVIQVILRTLSQIGLKVTARDSTHRIKPI